MWKKVPARFSLEYGHRTKLNKGEQSLEDNFQGLSRQGRVAKFDYGLTAPPE